MWSTLLIPITATLAATAVRAATSHAAVGAHSSLGHNKGSQSAEGDISNRNTFQVVSHPDFPNHKFRIKESKLCGDKDKIYSGYLDIAEHTHMFFTFAESRDTPDKDPLLLWLNGGPGCSSMAGFLHENGPCLVTNEGKNSTFNPYSWNSNANMIFLDSPVKVGFSKARKPVGTSRGAADDIYAFMQLFYRAFFRFAKSDLHLTGESYAAMYLPNVASVIFNKNKLLGGASSSTIHVPLATIAIGNGFFEIVAALRGQVDFACGKGVHAPIYNASTCAALYSQVPICKSSVDTCRQSPTPKKCQQAEWDCFALEGQKKTHPLRFATPPSMKAPADSTYFTYCFGFGNALDNFTTIGPYAETGLSPYDVTKKCDRSPDKDGPLCDKDVSWLSTYLNLPEIRAELGVDAKAKPFEECSDPVYDAFERSGDLVGNTPALLPELLESGIRLLVYSGTNDFICNYLGARSWTTALEWSGHKRYVEARFHEFKMADGKDVGKTKGFGPLTCVEVDGAGHMVPHDKPAVALEMINLWIRGGRF